MATTDNSEDQQQQHYATAQWSRRRGMMLFWMGMVVGMVSLQMFNQTQFAQQVNSERKGALGDDTGRALSTTGDDDASDVYITLDNNNKNHSTAALRAAVSNSVEDYKRLTTDPLASVEEEPAVAEAAVEPASTAGESTTIDVNPSLLIDPNIARKVLFVHVGKAGGNTVFKVCPKVYCQKILPVKVRTEEKMSKCVNRRSHAGSPLSSQCLAQIHMGNGVARKEYDRDYTTYLWVLRNPVTRVLSAYSYLHHNNTDSVFARSKHPLKENFYKSCFPTLGDFLATVQNLFHSSSNGNSDEVYDTTTDETKFLEAPTNFHHPQYCQRMAISVLKGRSPMMQHINVHMADNYQHYHGATTKAYPGKEVLVVRTESLWQDLKQVDQLLGGPGVFTGEGEIANQNVKTATTATTTAAKKTYKELCCVLWEELETFQIILNRARNLNKAEKLVTMQDVWTTCGIVHASQRFQGYDQRTADANALARSELKTGNAIITFSWFKWQRNECPDIGLSSSATKAVEQQ